MEQLKQLEELSKMLGGLVGEQDLEENKAKKKKNKEFAKKLASTIQLLYSASRVRIYKIADKIVSCEVEKGTELEDENEPPIPRAKIWDFKLGDRVKIKYSLADFKSIQCRTLGWNKRLHSVFGKTGIITGMDSEYENSVQVYVPEIYSTSSLYSGVLKKDFTAEQDPIPSRWKVGDYVTTKMDLKVVQILQRRRDTIPTRYLGRKGRVIAVTRAAVVVTFDEKTSYDINSYNLLLCPDQSPIEKKEVVHARGIKIGDTVKMLSNYKKLIENQKDKGGWNSTMSLLAGKEVTVVNVRKDGTLHVQLVEGRSWRVNSDSVLTDNEPGITEKDLNLIPGDVVKIKMPENIRLILEAANVPPAFLEYLRSTADLELVDDDLDYLIQFNCDQKVAAFAPVLKKATVDEIAKHTEIKSMVENIKIGDVVYFDVGPPNYVKTVLLDVNARPEVIKALTTPVKLVGFSEDRRAVIECTSGKRYKVKKKFLTVPDKFRVSQTREGMSGETAKQIQEMIATCVQIIHEGNEQLEKAASVGILSLLYGTPPCVDLRIYSMTATPHKICELLLQISGWDIEEESPGSGTFYIKKMASYTEEIKVSLYFNDEDYTPYMNWRGTKPVIDTKDQVGQESLITGENAPAKAAAEPFDDGPPPYIPPERPQLQGLEDFRFLRLFDPSLARNVYFPYVVHGQQRTPLEPEERQENERVTRNIIYNIDKVETITN